MPYYDPQPIMPAKLPLMRPRHGRVLCGVCRGIALHIGIPVWLVRLLAMALTPFFGAGPVAYIILVIALPAGDPQPYDDAPGSRGTQASDRRPQREKPLSKGNLPNDDDEASDNGLSEILRRTPVPLLLLGAGLALLSFGTLLAAAGLPANIILPLLLTACGMAVSWLRFDSERNDLTVLIVGIALMVASLALYAFTTYPFAQAGQVILVAALLLAGIAVALIPWANSLIRRLSTERAMKEREEERADMAAHLHDGVLQTLALIQLHSDDAQTVSTLARSQERSLRDWLYQDRPPADRSVSSGVRDIAAGIEVERGKAIEVVTVADAQPSERTEALLDATRQALLNAVTHGGEPISVYCEAQHDAVEIFVRDHGVGFDVRNIPEGRLGIRESIIGRVQRKGGTVEIVSRPRWGTEVRMRMPLAPDHERQQPSERDGAQQTKTAQTDMQQRMRKNTSRKDGS